jgi:hypothetical protein
VAVAGTKFSTGTCTGVNVPMAGEGSILDLGENFGHVGSILAVERGCSFGSYEFVI